ncbi:MAG: glycosyl hydrolase-related protein [Anaerolineales bacterium]
MAERHVLMFVSHTHWDREWYEPFEVFRLRLVRLIDRLLDILEGDAEYRFFMLDGQTIVLDDYLAVRPENEPRLRALITAGRLLIGPFHILPDEFLVSPESTVRNLLIGRATAAPFGGEMRLGNIPDPFGHISQMPQIMRGFGLDTMAFWRGVANVPNEFTWRGPDGSEVLVLFQRDGYGNASEMPPEPAAFVARTKRIIASLAPTATTPYLLAMNGSDHVEPMASLPTLLAQAQAALPEVELVHGTLPQFAAAIRSANPKLTVVEGELRSGQAAPLLPGVLSARLWLKQRNHACENLLTYWAEPYTALADTLGADTPLKKQAAVVRSIWRTLLLNHPHDSICGCSIDQVHKEMEVRYDRVDQAAESLVAQNLSALAGLLDTSETGSLSVAVFNPSTRARTDVVEVAVPLPPELATASLHCGDESSDVTLLTTLQEPVWDGPVTAGVAEFVMGMVTTGWRGLQVQRISISEPAQSPRIDAWLGLAAPSDPDALQARLREAQALLASHPEGLYMHVDQEPQAVVRFVARDVPGMGWKTYSVVPERTSPRPPYDRAGVAENEFVRVALATDGTLTVTDRRTGQEYSGLNRIVDEGDRGDEYNFCAVERGYAVTANEVVASAVQVEPCGRQTLWYELRCRVPASLGTTRQQRSHELVDLPVRVRASVTPGVRRVDIETSLINNARDHRVRAHFPVPTTVEAYQTEAHWDIITRPLDLPTGTADWVEQPIGTHPQRRWSRLVSDDGAIGLVLANRGLPEIEAIPTIDGSELALTLLRAVGWLSRDDLASRPTHVGPEVPTPAAQCLGPAVCHYSLIPVSAEPDADIDEALAYSLPLRAALATAYPGVLPLEGAFVRLEPTALELSALKAAEDGDGLIVRFWNRGDAPTTAHLTFWQSPDWAAQCRLDETLIEPLTIAADGSLAVAINAKQVVTVRVRMRATTPR